MPALLLILVIVVALACSQNVLALASSPISLCVRNCCVEL
jgi:hypothetical protein